jgi:hypothetical protein
LRAGRFGFKTWLVDLGISWWGLFKVGKGGSQGWR